MSLIVQKFGGSSVKDAKRIRKFKPLPMEEAMLRMKSEDDEDGSAPKENN